MKAAWVSLLSKRDYLAGLLVVDYGLRAARTKYPFVVMVTETLPEDARTILKKRGLKMVDIGSIRPGSGRESFDMTDARFSDTWSKIRVFELVEYDRVVLLDADMVVRRNMDELMDMDLGPNEIAAAHVCACNPRKRPHYPPDWIPENCPHTAVHTPQSSPPRWSPGKPRPYSELNSGLVVLNPSSDLASGIMNRLATCHVEKYYFPDQDLLSEHFKGAWKPLPWYYNALRTLKVIHPRMWSDDEVRCVHYILADKPWMERVSPQGVSPFDEMNRWWWADFAKLGEQMSQSDPLGWSIVSATVAPLG
ncbi:nucleotide-diphospho-sugar transferase [Hymenopellis radicata]|nr:nucleotide-diphospho-sugar transferase [Hymenopellis radicata]